VCGGGGRELRMRVRLKTFSVGKFVLNVRGSQERGECIAYFVVDIFGPLYAGKGTWETV
jgi:hypothetical protein